MLVGRLVSYVLWPLRRVQYLLEVLLALDHPPTTSIDFSNGQNLKKEHPGSIVFISDGLPWTPNVGSRNINTSSVIDNVKDPIPQVAIVSTLVFWVPDLDDQTGNTGGKQRLQNGVHAP